MPKNFQYTINNQQNDQQNIITIQLGLCAMENIELIRNAQPSWWWLHLDSVPSGHIIIMTDKINDDIINFAANICYQGISKKKQRTALFYKNNTPQYSIILTKISNLLIDIPSLQPGEVEFKSDSRKKLLKRFIIVKNDI